MARKINKKDNRYLARLVTEERVPCAFCQREVDDEVTYGKLYAIGDIQCHYYCCLLSCCLIQRGHEDEGLFGFVYTDILAELERCKKHRCSYCYQNGANIGCCVVTCRKQFHLPCGRERNAISLYYGSYKSFCQQHAPRQKIPEHIMSKAKFRMKADRMKIKYVKEPDKISKISTDLEIKDGEPEDMVCCICYEAVEGFPSVHTFWPPCCAKDAWFHRTCLQRMALSAGMHYLKCPLCNDKENFYEAVVDQGYYVPDRDAAWELEQNAFAEMYSRRVVCAAARCACPAGRGLDAEQGKWDIKLCLLCGSAGAHAYCIDQSEATTDDMPSLDQSESTDDAIALDQSPSKDIRYVCLSCQPAAPADLSALAKSIETIIQQEQNEVAVSARRPLMPTRMSLRRTKGRNLSLHKPSTSRSHPNRSENETSASPNVQSSRLELNLKTPRKPASFNETHVLRDVENKLLSPVKLLEQGFKEKVIRTGVKDAVLDESVIETLRRKFRKPRPLCEKKRIVNNTLDGLFDKLMKNAPKQKDQMKEWCSPKKLYEVKDHEDVLKTDSCQASQGLLNYENKQNDSHPNTPTKKINHKSEDITEMSNTFISDDIIEPEKEIVKTPTRDDKENCKMTTNFVPNIILIDNDDGHESLKNIENSNISVSTENTTEDKHNVIKPKKPTKVSPKRKNRKNINKKYKKLYGAAKRLKEQASLKKKQKMTDIENEEKNKLEILNSKSSDQETPTELDCSTNQQDVKENSELLQLLSQKDLAKKLLSKFNIINYESEVISEMTNTFTNGDIFGIQEKEIKTPTRNDEESCKMNSNSVPTIILIDDGDDNKERLISIENSNVPTDNTTDNNKHNITKPKRSKNISQKRKHRKIINKKYKKLYGAAKRLKEQASMKKKQKLTDIENEETNKLEILNSKSADLKTLTKLDSSKNQDLKENSEVLKQLLTQKDLPKQLLSKLNIDSKEVAKNFSEIDKNMNETPEHEETNNSDTLKTMETPKCKTIDIQQDSSLEISENDETINIDVIKIDDNPKDVALKLKLQDKPKTCAFKFSPDDKETLVTLETNDVGMDLENFKKVYLNEVDREFNCNFKHKHLDNISDDSKLRTAIDFAMEAVMKKELGIDNCPDKNSKKRKLSESNLRLLFDNSVVKKRKMSESDLNLSYVDSVPENTDVVDAKSVDDIVQKQSDKDKRKKNIIRKNKRRIKKNKGKTDKKNIHLTIDSSERRGKNKKIKNKIKTKFAIRNKDIHVRIKLKNKKLSLNIESKKQARKKKKELSSKFKQYILQFPEGSSKEILVRPENEVSPVKRKYVKKEKIHDNLKQTSIQSFFKLKSPDKNEQ